MLLAAYEQTDRLDSVPAPNIDWDVPRIIYESNADVIVELTSSDLLSGEPAAGYIRAALRQDRHVVTTNKGPLPCSTPNCRPPPPSARRHAGRRRYGQRWDTSCGSAAIRWPRRSLAHPGVFSTARPTTSRAWLTVNRTSRPWRKRRRRACRGQPHGRCRLRRGHQAGHPVEPAAGRAAQACQRRARRHPATDDEGCRPGAEGGRGEAGRLGRTAPDMVKACVKPIRLPQSHPLASVSGQQMPSPSSPKLLGDVTIVGPGAGRVEPATLCCPICWKSTVAQ